MADASETEKSATSQRLSPGAPTARQAGFGLLRRLALYHFAVGTALTILLMLFPRVPDYLPVGGVRDLASADQASDGRVDERAPVTGVPAARSAPVPPLGFDRLGHASRLAIALVGVWLLMLPVSWVHKGIYRSSGYDHSLDETTLILPGVVASIVLVVQYSLALAFALAGIVAGVQFRRALQDTFDALFILVAIGTGIAAGIGALEVAAVMTIFFCYTTVYVCCFGDGLESDFLADRKEKKRKRKVAAEVDEDDG